MKTRAFLKSLLAAPLAALLFRKKEPTIAVLEAKYGKNPFHGLCMDCQTRYYAACDIEITYYTPEREVWKRVGKDGPWEMIGKPV